MSYHHNLRLALLKSLIKQKYLHINNKQKRTKFPDRCLKMKSNGGSNNRIRLNILKKIVFINSSSFWKIDSRLSFDCHFERGLNWEFYLMVQQPISCNLT